MDQATVPLARSNDGRETSLENPIVTYIRAHHMVRPPKAGVVVMQVHKTFTSYDEKSAQWLFRYNGRYGGVEDDWGGHSSSGNFGSFKCRFAPAEKVVVLNPRSNSAKGLYGGVICALA